MIMILRLRDLTPLKNATLRAEMPAVQSVDVVEPFISQGENNEF
jgi:hypothetical protein